MKNSMEETRRSLSPTSAARALASRSETRNVRSEEDVFARHVGEVSPSLATGSGELRRHGLQHLWAADVGGQYDISSSPYETVAGAAASEEDIDTPTQVIPLPPQPTTPLSEEPSQLLALPAPIGYTTDVVENQRFVAMFAHILPSDISPFAITLQFGIKHGIIFKHQESLYIAMGQNYEIRRIVKPRTPARLLEILKCRLFTEALSNGMESVYVADRSEFAIQLASENYVARFNDHELRRTVAVTNIHTWAIWRGGQWNHQICVCDTCEEKRQADERRRQWALVRE